MAELAISVLCVKTVEGERHYVTCLPEKRAFARGLPPEAILGTLVRPLQPGEAIAPALFARNPAFVQGAALSS